MKKMATLFTFLLIAVTGRTQMEPQAGNWKTWFIANGKDYRLAAPDPYKNEIVEVIAAQKSLDAAGRKQIIYWNAGAPGYHWQELMANVWMTDRAYNGALSNMLLGTATYDATIAAWDTKYAYKRPRPFATDNRIKAYGLKPESPSYPCEHSVAAGAAVAVISHFFPHLKDSVTKMAQRVMTARIAAGMAFPSDTRAGFELGKRIAEKEIEHTKDFTPKTTWDGKIPEGPQYWKGKQPALPLAGQSKTVVLTSASQFRPAPPPDFAKDMAEMKNYKSNFMSKANAFYYASHYSGDEMLNQKIFEHNLHLNPPRAARIYAAKAIGIYDGFTACWDAKYAYWGIRPDQYDTTYKPLIPTPPFPGYPSGHAAIGAVAAELYTYFFPDDKALFDKMSEEGAESRFQGGIHFRTDNEVGVELGRKVGNAIVQKLKTDGADR